MSFVGCTSGHYACIPDANSQRHTPQAPVESDTGIGIFSTPTQSDSDTLIFPSNDHHHSHSHTAEIPTPTPPFTPVEPDTVASPAQPSESSQTPSLPTWPLVTVSDSQGPSTSISTEFLTFPASASARSSPAAGALPSNVSLSRTPHLGTGTVTGIGIAVAVAVCLVLAGMLLLYVKRCRGRRTVTVMQLGGIYLYPKFADSCNESSLASPLAPLSATAQAADPTVTMPGHISYYHGQPPIRRDDGNGVYVMWATDEKRVPDSPRNRTLRRPTLRRPGDDGDVNQQTEPAFEFADAITSRGAPWQHETDGGVSMPPLNLGSPGGVDIRNYLNGKAEQPQPAIGWFVIAPLSAPT
ncbi:hypothetical protein V8D89_014364 [Ganoderma adspersum]